MDAELEADEQGIYTVLVEEREAEMVAAINTNSVQPTKRKAFFLKPASASTSHHSIRPAPISPAAAASSVSFGGWRYPQRRWSEWVTKLTPIYQHVWKNVGIFDAIICSTFCFRKEVVSGSAILEAAQYWSSETNTFVFPWGEATITLEDILVLTGFSLLGEAVRASISGEMEEMVEELENMRRSFTNRSSRKADYSNWLNCHIDSGGGDRKEHAAFLSLWLSRYVFPTNTWDTIDPSAFPLAARLADGRSIALGPAVLASIYRDLGIIKEQILNESSGSLNVCAPFWILQLWLWERFVDLQPEMHNILNIDGSRAGRWKNLCAKTDASVARSVFTSANNFNRRPYAVPLDDWALPSFYGAQDVWLLVMCNEEEDEDGRLRSFARCLRPCELVGLDCIEKYLPHRVAMQFGYDQDIPNRVARANSSWEEAWTTYNGHCDDFVLHLPPILFQPEVTVRYSNWWKQFDNSPRKKQRPVNVNVNVMREIMIRRNAEREKKKKLMADADCKKRKLCDDHLNTPLSNLLRSKMHRSKVSGARKWNSCVMKKALRKEKEGTNAEEYCIRNHDGGSPKLQSSKETERTVENEQDELRRKDREENEMVTEEEVELNLFKKLKEKISAIKEGLLHLESKYY